MRADNTRHIIAAAQRRHELTRAKAIQALRTLDAQGRPVTFEAVAQAAAVSRSWLYAQPDLRAQIEQLRPRNHQRPATAAPPERQRSTGTSLLRRLQAASDRIRRLDPDNQQLHAALAQALGEHRQAAITGRRAPGRDTPINPSGTNLKPC